MQMCDILSFVLSCRTHSFLFCSLSPFLYFIYSRHQSCIGTDFNLCRFVHQISMQAHKLFFFGECHIHNVHECQMERAIATLVERNVSIHYSAVFTTNVFCDPLFPKPINKGALALIGSYWYCNYYKPVSAYVESNLCILTSTDLVTSFLPHLALKVLGIVVHTHRS